MVVPPKNRPPKNSSGRYIHIYTDLPDKLAKFVFLFSKMCINGVIYTTNIGATLKSNHTLKSLLTHNKTPIPSHIQQNVIYRIPCDDFVAFYIGQTYRPLIKRIKKLEACHRLNNFIDSSTGNIKSTPAKHSHEHGHNIAWKSTAIIASCDHRSQLNLLEDAAITTKKPSMNIQHKGPRVNACWKPLLDNIAASFIYKHANLNIGS